LTAPDRGGAVGQTQREGRKAIFVESRPIALVARGGSGSDGNFTYGQAMTIAKEFIFALQREQRNGNVSSETEQHLKHEFRKLGRDAFSTMLTEAVDAEIDRLVRQATTLRRLRETLLGVA